MANIRELSLSEIELVSGGGNSGDHEHNFDRHSESGARNTLGRNAPTHIYSEPSTVACANSAFGALGSLPNIGRASAKEVGAIVQCMRDNSSTGNGNTKGSGHCGGGIGGTCHR